MDTMDTMHLVNITENYVTNKSETTPIAPFQCISDSPYASNYLEAIPCWGRGLLVLHGLICLINLLVFVEMVIFFVKNFHDGDRLNGTIWYLALFPVFSVSCLISLLIPRSGVLNTLVADLYFAVALHRLIGLMENYLGGPNMIAKYLSKPRLIKINTLPVACCCVFLPQIHLNRKNYILIYIVIMQHAIVRPLCNYISAVLWTNNSFIPGTLGSNNAYVYLAFIILFSTIFCVWGLIIINVAFSAELDGQYKMPGKLITIQLMLIISVVMGIIIAALVNTNVIACSEFLPSDARGGEIYHQVMNFVSLLVLILCRFFFRRTEDADEQRYVHFTSAHNDENHIFEA